MLINNFSAISTDKMIQLLTNMKTFAGKKEAFLVHSGEHLVVLHSTDTKDVYEQVATLDVEKEKLIYYDEGF